jgi:hypothetical protein
MGRTRALICSTLLLAGCVGPHSTGALWAQQNLEQEDAQSHLGDAGRAAQTQTFVFASADAALAHERARIEDELQTCPGPPQPLAISPGDSARDAIRLDVQGDPRRLSWVAQVALADWRMRRAAATGDVRFCDAARAALDGGGTDLPQSSSDLLSSLPPAVVTRDPTETSAALETGAPTITLSNYALGYVDTVEAAAPLPQYLALVYGGFLVEPAVAPMLDAEAAATRVDREASAFSEWEPDALYAALRGGQT